MAQAYVKVLTDKYSFENFMRRLFESNAEVHEVQSFVGDNQSIKVVTYVHSYEIYA